MPSVDRASLRNFTLSVIFKLLYTLCCGIY